MDYYLSSEGNICRYIGQLLRKGQNGGQTVMDGEGLGDLILERGIDMLCKSASNHALILLLLVNVVHICHDDWKFEVELRLGHCSAELAPFQTLIPQEVRNDVCSRSVSPKEGPPIYPSPGPGVSDRLADQRD
jgi:hypothetical protein